MNFERVQNESQNFVVLTREYAHRAFLIPQLDGVYKMADRKTSEHFHNLKDGSDQKRP